MSLPIRHDVKNKLSIKFNKLSATDKTQELYSPV